MTTLNDDPMCRAICIRKCGSFGGEHGKGPPVLDAGRAEDNTEASPGTPSARYQGDGWLGLGIARWL